MSLDGADRVLGVYVAEFGTNSTVRTLRIDQYVVWQRVTSQDDTMITTSKVAVDYVETRRFTRISMWWGLVREWPAAWQSCSATGRL